MSSTARPGLQRRATSQPPPATRTKVRFADQSPESSPTSSGPATPTRIRQRRSGAAQSTSAQPHDGYESDDAVEQQHRRRRRRHTEAGKERDRSDSPPASDSTEELPDRFDKYGRPLPQTDENHFSDKFEELLAGKGGMGRLLRSWGLGGDAEEKADGISGSGSEKRRRRRRE